MGDAYLDPPHSFEGRFLLIHGTGDVLAPGHAVPGEFHRPPSVDSQRKPGTGLAAGRDRHRGGSPAPTCNATSSLTGQTVPDPTSLTMLTPGAAAVFAAA